VTRTTYSLYYWYCIWHWLYTRFFNDALLL